MGKDFHAASAALLDKLLTSSIHLQLCDNKVGWMNWKLNGLTVCFLVDDRVDIDTHLAKLDSCDFAFSVLIDTRGKLNFIIAVDWKSLDSVGFLKLLGKRCTKCNVLLVL